MIRLIRLVKIISYMVASYIILMCLGCNVSNEGKPCPSDKICGNELECEPITNICESICGKDSDCKKGLACNIEQGVCYSPKYREIERKKHLYQNKAKQKEVVVGSECIHKKECKDDGKCGLSSDGTCVALSDEHCRLSKACTVENRCVAYKQFCVREGSKKCNRGIHKGQEVCQIERGYIEIVNSAVKMKVIDEQHRIIPETRVALLELLGDKRTQKKCKPGYSYNYEYKGQASWKMYNCFVQDRLIWYLYLVGHHFDSSIQIIKGLSIKDHKETRHHNGHAVDFRVTGVPSKAVWQYVKQTFPLIGAGYSFKNNHVHLDVGRDKKHRYWLGGCRAKRNSKTSQRLRGRALKAQSGMLKSIQRVLKRHYKSFLTQQKFFQNKKRKRRRAR